MPDDLVTLVHVFIYHSNMWGGARGASRLKNPKLPDLSARVSSKHLDHILVGRRTGISTKIIGHMWRLMALHQTAPTLLILASGDGKKNEFGTSFYEILREVLTRDKCSSWRVQLASFDWAYPNAHNLRSPTSSKMKDLVTSSDRGEFTNLFEHYDKVVYHKEWTPLKPGAV